MAGGLGRANGADIVWADVRPDHRPGRSTCTRPVPSLDDLLRWLDELFDGLQLGGGINVVELSYGGALAAQYALRHPERVKRTVLLAPAQTVLRISVLFMARLFLAAFSPRWCLRPLVRWMFADMARKDPRWIDATLELLSMNMRSIQPRKVPIPPVLTDAEWAGLQAPVMLVVGENEVIYVAEKAASRLKRVAPRTRVEIVPHAGHDLTFVQAGLVNRLMLEFLRQ